MTILMTLKRSEWPQEIIEYMSDEIIELAQVVREFTVCVMIPSPLSAAHVRFTNGSSLHCVGEGGQYKSQATDIYINPNEVNRFMTQVQRVSAVGAIGLYFDTDLNGARRPMVHIDTRPERLLWVCPDRCKKKEKRRYIYKHIEPVQYHQELANGLHSYGCK